MTFASHYILLSNMLYLVSTRQYTIGLFSSDGVNYDSNTLAPNSRFHDWDGTGSQSVGNTLSRYIYLDPPFRLIVCCPGITLRASGSQPSFFLCCVNFLKPRTRHGGCSVVQCCRGSAYLLWQIRYSIQPSDILMCESSLTALILDRI